MKLITKVYNRKDDRGTFTECINDDQCWKSINSGTMNAGAIMGNHYHKNCKAFFFLLSGSASIYIKNVRDQNSKIVNFLLNSDEGVIFEPYETHAIKYEEDSKFLFLKSEKFDKENSDLNEAKLI